MGARFYHLTRSPQWIRAQARRWTKTSLLNYFLALHARCSARTSSQGELQSCAHTLPAWLAGWQGDAPCGTAVKPACSLADIYVLISASSRQGSRHSGLSWTAAHSQSGNASHRSRHCAASRARLHAHHEVEPSHHHDVAVANHHLLADEPSVSMPHAGFVDRDGGGGGARVMSVPALEEPRHQCRQLCVGHGPAAAPP